MLEKFYPSHVIGRLTINEDEFWDNKVVLYKSISKTVL